MSGEMNHFDEAGNAVMVDVSGKSVTTRTASAIGAIRVNQEIMDAVLQKKVTYLVLHEWQESWRQNRHGL